MTPERFAAEQRRGPGQLEVSVYPMHNPARFGSRKQERLELYVADHNNGIAARFGVDNLAEAIEALVIVGRRANTVVLLVHLHDTTNRHEEIVRALRARLPLAQQYPSRVRAVRMVPLNVMETP